MSASFVIISFVAYFALLFAIAFYAERRERIGKSIIRNSPWVYSLSIAVYCTAWTYFGSIGRAASTGYGFLPIYLGPTITAPLWIYLLRKIIRISKAQRINSIADFISARYGKAALPGVIATIIAILGTIPYISIQLKAITFCLDILSNHAIRSDQSVSIYSDAALYVAIGLALFTILFGTRNVDPNERHEGLVAAIAFESIFKLIAFIAAGLFIVYGIHNGIGDLFQKASALPEVKEIIYSSADDISGTNWFCLLLLSGVAVIFLPRQFHVSVVENTNSSHVKQAAWVFPLYLFLINLFVLPIAVAGLLQYSGTGVEADTFILQLPLDYGKSYLALFIALGGVSAAASMVIVAVTALSIMISNSMIMPLIIRSRQLQSPYVNEFHKRLIRMRRLAVFVILILAYGYFKSVGQQYSIVSIGLISFAAVAQFAPALLGGLIWRRATKTGAVAGMIGGIIVWGFTLPIHNLIEIGLLPQSIIEKGLFGISLLKPDSLFGIQMSDPIAHATFWSLLINTGLYYVVSLATQPSAIVLTQADYFINFNKYRRDDAEQDFIKRETSFKGLQNIAIKYLGAFRAQNILLQYEKQTGSSVSNKKLAPSDYINYVERNLAGALGTSSAKVLINSIVEEENISMNEIIKIVDQTYDTLQYSKKLEASRTELEQASKELRAANIQLRELDDLKDEFISTVTHELRTPVTSIASLAKIIRDTPDLAAPERDKFLDIIVSESQRLSRIVNQVLDIEKLQSNHVGTDRKNIRLADVIHNAIASIEKSATAQDIEILFDNDFDQAEIFANKDHVMQIMVNLLSNALKFCPKTNGVIHITLLQKKSSAVVSIKDNGIGIPLHKQRDIFDRFTQVHNDTMGKPSGSGLGLYITKKLVTAYGGTITVQSAPNEGSTFLLTFPLVIRDMS